MKKQPRRKTWDVSGFLLFFCTSAITVTIAFFAYSLVDVFSHGNKLAIALTVLGAIFLTAIVCTLCDVIRRRIMIDRPVSRILSATEKIAKGDFSVRLDVSHSLERYDDYDLIMENLNAMSEELSKSELLKKDFISNVSHEIKTPLAVIQSYASLLKEETDGETRAKYTQTILFATQRLNRLVQDVLLLNKLENQGLKPERAPVKLHDQLAECILQYEDLLERKNISLSCDLEETEIDSVAPYLEIVWNNLLSNAVKFTPENGEISVSLTGTGKGAIVCVTDSGCGISPQTGARIFDKFYQADSSRAQEGNGLGLALVKKVIDLLGGEISVKSEEGKGSTFTVRLKGE